VTDIAQSVERPAAASTGNTAGGARVLRGAPPAKALRERVGQDAADFRQSHGYSPVLVAVMVGHEQASSVYVQQILRTCQQVDVPSRVVELPSSTSEDELRTQIKRLNEDRDVAGVIVQMPLPEHIPLAAVTDTILPVKDIDGIHPLNTGLMALGYEGFLPACAEAAVSLLRESGYALEGKRAVVIGRSNVVGKPVQLLLMREHCTVTVCHRRTRNLPQEVRRAEVLVTAAGAPRLVAGEMLSPGVLIADVGINVVPEGIVGDVDYESASEVAAAITPVPGGVGPLTNAVLLEHLVRAARWQATGHPITAGHGRRHSVL
jgi:methylenetetrahydrofolate dehydrogenase (NADP+) / methenyltetrahydrofolate cyclohydrolase